MLRAGQDLHQGGLAGSIFANEHVHRALVHREIDGVQRQCARIAFRDLFSEHHYFRSVRRDRFFRTHNAHLLGDLDRSYQQGSLGTRVEGEGTEKRDRLAG